MKKNRKHPERALSAVAVRGAKQPGRYADGNGLYLVVDPSGAKRWLMRTVIQGRRRDIGLGSVKLVSLAEARDLAAQYRRVARAGGDPLSERRKAQVAVPSFAEAAHTVHQEHQSAWRNAKHGAQWINTLQAYAFPLIGERRIDQIDTPDLLRVLSPIWLTKPETARRLRQRLAAVFDWAKAAGHRVGENPVLGVAKGLPKQPDRVSHMAALPFAEVPTFVHALRTCDASEPVRLAFELLILTATRTSEVLGARWKEFDLDEGVWVIPANRIKAGRAHRIPLTQRCVSILKRARILSGESPFVFPGRSGDKPLSNMVFLMTLRRMKRDCTAHGFRSAFRDWAAERTGFPREVCEMALAHAIGDKVEAAYRRGDLFDKRRELMATWAAFVTGSGRKVVSLRA